MTHRILIILLSFTLMTAIACDSTEEKAAGEGGETTENAEGQSAEANNKAGMEKGEDAKSADANKKTAMKNDPAADGIGKKDNTPADPKDMRLLWDVTGKCVKGDCLSGKSIKKYSNGYTYEGDFKDGIPHSPNEPAVLTHKDGTAYEGPFMDGRFHGWGQYKSGGSPFYYYWGKFTHGHYHGKGTMIFPDNRVYIGSFRNGLRQGNGIMVKSKGKTYISSTWTKGLRNTANDKVLEQSPEKYEARTQRRRAREKAYIFMKKMEKKGGAAGGDAAEPADKKDKKES